MLSAFYIYRFCLIHSSFSLIQFIVVHKFNSLHPKGVEFFTTNVSPFFHIIFSFFSLQSGSSLWTCFCFTMNLLQSIAQRILGVCANIQYPSNSIDRRNGPVESAIWIVQEKCIRIITMLISSRLFVGRIAQTAHHPRFQSIESRLSHFCRFEITCD